MIDFKNIDHAKIIATLAGAILHKEDPFFLNIENDRLLGGVIFKEYTRASIQIHCAGISPYWLNRELLWASFHYPFVQLGVDKLFAPVPASNPRALAFDLKLGFKEDNRIKDVYPEQNGPGSGDLILLSMRADECRWLELKPRALKFNTEIMRLH